MNFHFLFLFFFFLHVYFYILSVLSVPSSRNIDIIFHFLPINYWILTHMGLNDRCNLLTIFFFQSYAKSQNCTSLVPLRFPALFLASESRWGARHSTYLISNVIKLALLRSPYWCDTVVGDSTRQRDMPLAMLTMKNETQGFHNFYAWFSYVSPISIGMGLCYRPLEPAKPLRYKVNKGCLVLSCLVVCIHFRKLCFLKYPHLK